MKNLFFTVVVLLCIQTLYAGSPTSTSCTSDLSALRAKADEYITKFNNEHQYARNIANDKIFPICRSIYTARAQFRSPQYINNASGLLAAVITFTDPVPQVIQTLLGYLNQLTKEVKTLSRLQKDFTSKNRITCDAENKTTDACASDKNKLECVLKSFNDAVPFLADDALGLLEAIKKGSVNLGNIVKRFRAIKNPTERDVKAFIEEFGKAHDTDHGLFEMFRSLCVLVDGTLTTVVIPAVKGK